MAADSQIKDKTAMNAEETDVADLKGLVYECETMEYIWVGARTKAGEPTSQKFAI